MTQSPQLISQRDTDPRCHRSDIGVQTSDLVAVHRVSKAIF